MKTLAVSHNVPRPDQSSGELRFYTLLSLLARKHDILLCALNADGTIQPRDEAGARLEQVGIMLGEVDLPHVLKCFKPDIVWFEFYHQARSDYLALLERHCPQARIVVDSVDVHFNRLESQARLTGKSEDEAAAQQMKVRELAAYATADMVIAVSENDRQLIRQALPDIPVDIIPNLHAIPPLPDRTKRQYGELLFVGGFRHDPNVDAMLYFCREIMPLITATHPKVRLKIIGSHPPKVIRALASKHVDVLGYVPETAPHLESAYISVAPLRYGGGMKGKVGEAMSYGLPVVTTSFGAEGFELQPGVDLLIGDTAESFAMQVIALLDNSDLHDRISHHGYDFIAQHFSVPAVEKLLDSTMQRLTHFPLRVIPLRTRVMTGIQSWYAQHIAWRINKNSSH